MKAGDTAPGDDAGGGVAGGAAQREAAPPARSLGAQADAREAADNVAGPSHPPPPKQRKPYQLTKSRERWSPIEHGKFLEALKLYGRQWRKIEGECLIQSGVARAAVASAERWLAWAGVGDRARPHVAEILALPLQLPTTPPPKKNKEHVATKTAVQIRSHAQKFFNKIERGAASEGAEESDSI